MKVVGRHEWMMNYEKVEMAPHSLIRKSGCRWRPATFLLDGNMVTLT